MYRYSLLAILLLCSVSINAQILYRIYGNGLSNTSFVVGTHHLVDESFVEQIPGIESAIKQTSQVYGEVIMSDMMNPDTLQFIQQAMLLPKDETIKDILSADYYNSLNELFTNLTGIPFDNPLIFQSMGRMTPDAVSNQILTLSYMKAHFKDFDPNKGMDLYFQNEALKAGKKVYGLESIAYQVDILFKAPLEDGAAELQCILDNQAFYFNSITTLTEAYRKQDEKAISKALEMKLGNSCDSLNSEEQLIDERNCNWMKKMPTIMKGAPTLFVVGAGHLFGENGLINLMRNAGYTVEPVRK